MKFTTEMIKQIIKEELSAVLEEGLTPEERKRAKPITYEKVKFLVVPLTNDELERADPKFKEPKERYDGIYRIKYEKDTSKEHLYNALLGYSMGKKYSPAYTDKQLESYGIDPSVPINFVVYISNPKPEVSKAVYQALRPFLLMR